MNLLAVSAIALVIGAIVAWLVRGSLVKVAVAGLEAQLSGAEQQLVARGHEVSALRGENQRIVESLRLETERRASGEAIAARVPVLEQRIWEQQQMHDEQVCQLARIETQIAEERKAADEKVALMNQAQETLTGAFSSLSSQALKSNSEEFLRLAKLSLEKFQEGARSDLDARRKTVDELVRPMRESLEKVDSKLAEIEGVRVSAYAALSEQLKGLSLIHI